MDATQYLILILRPRGWGGVGSKEHLTSSTSFLIHEGRWPPQGLEYSGASRSPAGVPAPLTKGESERVSWRCTSTGSLPSLPPGRGGGWIGLQAAPLHCCECVRPAAPRRAPMISANLGCDEGPSKLGPARKVCELLRGSTVRLVAASRRNNFVM